jgi:hypothetical protein
MNELQRQERILADRERRLTELEAAVAELMARLVSRWRDVPSRRCAAARTILRS